MTKRRLGVLILAAFVLAGCEATMEVSMSAGGGESESGRRAEGAEPVSTGAPDPQELQDEPTDLIPDGLEVYEVRCAGCHGEEGEGTDRAPQLRFRADEYATWVVRNGRESTKFPNDMPAFEDVSDAQLDEMLAWLGSFPNPTTAQDLYARYCGNCHGPDGRGGGEPAVGEEYSKTREQIREGEGDGLYGDRAQFMPGWGTDSLSDQEVELLARYLGVPD